MRILLVFMVTAALHGACLMVESDHILARDVAPAIAEFSRIPAEEVIGLAPLPAVRRIMSGGELVRIAARFGLVIAAPIDVCFEYPTEILTREKVVENLTRSLDVPEAEMELIDFSRYPVPHGELSFPRSGLNVHPLLTERSIVFWRGKVTYGGMKSVSVWARVRMSVMRERLVAAETIPAGSVVTEQQVRMQPVKQFPLDTQPPVPADAVVGRVAKRTAAAGQVLAATSFALPKEVIRGAEVSVLVKADGTQLSIPALAQSSGAIGETVSLKNPVNGRSFRGVVDGKNRVLVTAK